MPRRCTSPIAAITLVASMLPMTAHAQVSDADSQTARNLLSGSLVPKTSREECAAPTRQGEIIVCAPDKEKNRVLSSADQDPTSRSATNDGRLHGPDFEPHYPGIVVARGCMIPPCPPAPVYMIDLSKIPKPPAGSDAEKIANGEMAPP